MLSPDAKCIRPLTDISITPPPEELKREWTGRKPEKRDRFASVRRPAGFGRR